MKSFTFSSLFSFVLLLSLSVSFALARDIFVSSSLPKASDVQGCGCAIRPCATIQFAIKEAQDGDSIVLQGSRSFQLTSTVVFSDAQKKLKLTALPTRSQKRLGSAQLSQIHQKFAVLDCRGLNNNHMAISVGQGVSLTLENIVIENCHSHSSAALGAFLPAELVLDKVAFRNNVRVRGSGAALSIFGGKVIVRSSTFEKNIAMSGSGGAISCTHGCNLVLEDTLISNNEAKITAGGIFAQSSNVVAQKVVIESNKANKAAGLHTTEGGSVSLQEVDFDANVAENTCSQLLIHAPNDHSIAFVRTVFVSSNSTSEDSGFEEGVCLDGVKGGARFEETLFEGLGLSCARTEFVFQDSVEYEAQRLGDERVLPPVSCKDSCRGWSGEEKLCKL